MVRTNFFRSIFTIAVIGLIGLIFVECSDQNTDEVQKQEFVTTDLSETGVFGALGVTGVWLGVIAGAASAAAVI